MIIPRPRLSPSSCILTTGYVFLLLVLPRPVIAPPVNRANIQATTKVRTQIQECRTELSLSTKPYDSHNPRVIAEYLEAGDEERSSFQQIFGACKLLMQLQSKGRWYVWKRGLIERLGPDVEGILEEVIEVSHLVSVKAVRI